MRVKDLPLTEGSSSSVHVIDDARNILRVEGYRVGVIADLGKQTEDGRNYRVHVGTSTQLRRIEAWARDLQTLVSPMRGHPFLRSHCSCHRFLGDAHLLRILLTEDEFFWHTDLDWVYNDNELEDFHKFLLWNWEASEKPGASVSYPATKKQLALLLKRVDQFHGQAVSCCWWSRRICRTENNMLGLVDLTARLGDILFS